MAPPPVKNPRGPIAWKFEGAEEKSRGLAAAFDRVAHDKNCSFFDAGRVTETSAVDGVHLDPEQHRTLGSALAEVVRALLTDVEA